MMLNPALRRIVPSLLWVSLPMSALHAQSAERDRSLISVVGMDLTSADIVAWCDSTAPADAGPLRAAWQSWRARAEIDNVTRAMSADLLASTRTSMATVIVATRQRLSGMGAPARSCRQLSTMWSTEAFDVRSKFPLAYTLSSAAAIAPASDAAAVPNAGPTPRAGRRFDPKYYFGTSRPAGEVYTVAQLTALVDGWFGTPRSAQRANARLRASNPLFVRGKVVSHNERLFLETNDGTFRSKLRVAPGIDLSAFEGEEVTLALTLDELPGSLVFPDETRVVRDASGLRLSTLSEDAGRQRLAVDVARIRAEAGHEPATSRIRGMHYRGYGATGASGYEFRGELRLLFSDGWAYTRDDLPPGDLNVEASRRLEPQHWERWRQAGTEYEFQSQDDFGQPEDEWERKPGRLLPTWKPNQRVAGSYTAAAFYGSVALGGTYSQSTYVLGNDGRWEYLGFSRSSSATMAAQSPGEFSSSASSTTDGKGTQSNAGGGNPGVFVGTRTRTDDGAKNRGTYRLDGMTLELRSDAGEVKRYLCVPLDASGDSFYFQGQSFSRKKP